nr:hypothetical protein GCM10020063_075510 [Dactylosporangium thailandense]
MRGSKWWSVVVVGAACVLLFAWLGRLAGVTGELLWTVGAAFAALTWTLVLVSAPWNLYFGARRVVAEAAESRDRGIAVKDGHEAEARRIARRMLGFAVAGHVGTAVVAAVAGFVTGRAVGYYVAGFFLLSTLMRPAGAYFSHLHQRITVMTREVTHPREDVVTLRRDVAELQELVQSLQRQADEQHRVADEDRDVARERDEQLRQSIERMVRRIDSAVDGISDHQDLLAGLRALVRMIRSEPV